MHPYDPKLIITSDGSHSLYIPKLDEHYHSRHGALQEASHVFIDKGLTHYKEFGHTACRIFEVGFGTGLNALLSAVFAEQFEMEINYTSLELYPLESDMAKSMNYPALISFEKAPAIFDGIHGATWETEVEVSPFFNLTKINADILTYEGEKGQFDLIFFDAFGYRAQSELWGEDVFQRCFKLLRPGGFLTTYASKGIVRRVMQSVGFKVEKLPGPPGKREMVRAQKPLL